MEMERVIQVIKRIEFKQMNQEEAVTKAPINN
jgi:hypothetical protein